MANYGDVNPKTGKLYKPEEIMKINSGLETSTELETTSINIAATGPLDLKQFAVRFNEYSPSGSGHPAHMEHQEALNAAWKKYQETGEMPWGETATEEPNEMVPYKPEVTTPTFGEGAAAGIPTPTVTPAPLYEILPEQQEMMDLLSTTITDWVTSGGYGLPPEIQAQMIQQQTDTLKAREQEAIRVMKNNMERRGITNSGYVQANMNMITSNTSVAIAGAIADVQIKSALMKMASFEKAMGAAAQFLGYLSEQSQLAYAPEFATWQAEQLANLQAWQGKLDVYKMELNQAYQTQNMALQAQLTSKLNQEQHQFDLKLAEMEIEANQKTAMAQGIGGIFGTILGFLFGK